MTIPGFQSLMLPLLEILGDKKEHSLQEVIETLASRYHLTDEERRELLPSGRQSTFSNRVGWARTHMKKAALIAPTKRGCFQITERGLAVLKQPPTQINIAFLNKYPEFVEFRRRRDKPEEVSEPEEESTQTPDEAMESAYQRVQQELASELLHAVKTCSPAFFERLVIDLLVKMGYGGTRKDAGEAIGRPGDEGIDGVINEDRLGLDVVYIQAKRWDGTVGRPEIQKFAGALAGQRGAQKGIFITTSAFSKDAQDYISKIGSRIVLIDGNLLAQLMMDYDIGVATTASYALKRVDSDYFSEE